MTLAGDPVFAVFRSELVRHTATLRAAVDGLAQNPSDDDGIDATERAAHALRGVAMLVGVKSVASVTQSVEAYLATVRGRRSGIGKGGLGDLREAVGVLESAASDASEAWGAEHERQSEEVATKLRARCERPSLVVPAVVAPAPIAARAAPRALADSSMLAIFRGEAEGCTSALAAGLVELDTSAASPQNLEALMRAAHSVKGAARIVGLDLVVELAHAMEDCFVAAQERRLEIGSGDIDVLLSAVDKLGSIAKQPESTLPAYLDSQADEVHELARAIAGLAHGERRAHAPQATRAEAPVNAKPGIEPPPQPAAPDQHAPGDERVVRVAAESINRLMGLAGESLVEARRLNTFTGSMQQLKQRYVSLSDSLSQIEQLGADASRETLLAQIAELKTRALDCREALGQRVIEFDAYARRMDDLSDRLYREAQKTRMRPFADGVHTLPRLVRDLARELGKSVKFEIIGESTQVDRDVLESLEAPLSHLLRNAVDHGLETPEQRVSRGKPPQGSVRVEARHHAGMLSIRVSDDGRGIDPETVRRKAVERGLVSAEMSASLSKPELMEFLFLPGFSTAGALTEISGRGVGLDVVRSVVTAIGGSVSATSELERGTSFQLELPVTRSVLRAILVEIAGEPYAFPLLRIERVVRVPIGATETLENSQYFALDGRNIGLLRAEQVLRLEQRAALGNEVSVVVIGDRTRQLGVVVDCFLGEQDLVVRPLDPRLGKVQDIAAAAILADGSPALIVDVDDLLRSIDKLVESGRLEKVGAGAALDAPRARKRILVVDDSITVREVERQLLVNRGYDVDVAVDGVDGWNSVRGGEYDLVITDVDMPRMSGVELVRAIKQDARRKSMPVVIVSYKDREEDRLSGLNAGANYYLTKSSFQDDTFVSAVEDLIGTATS